jgi:UDP-arabinose 4-epimerase
MNDVRTILVTGGAGYIGSHACAALARAGYVPVAYDNLSTGHRESARWGPLEVGDICDHGGVGAVLQKYKPEAIMHFAAKAYVGESMENPLKYYRNNVAGTITLLEAALAHEVRFFVLSSSCATYGIPLASQVSETTPQAPISPYGATKLFCERVILDFCRSHGMTAALLRYFNAAGAHPTAPIGESHDPEPHLIPCVLDVACGRAPEVRIYGGDHQTVDGSCVRDYVHVCDLADAHVLALKYLEQGGVSDAFNLGNGKGFSVLQVIEAASRVTGRAIPYRVCERRAGDPAAVFADAGKAASRLGWRPNFADLEVIIQHAWRWHQHRAY